jgi:hypothetical protein
LPYWQAGLKVKSPKGVERKCIFSGYGGHDDKDHVHATEAVRVAARVRPYTYKEQSSLVRPAINRPQSRSMSTNLPCSIVYTLVHAMNE